MKHLLFLALLTLSFNTFAEGLDFAPYIKIQEAIAADDFKSALDAHKALCDKKPVDYSDCAKEFKHIDVLRTSFKSLSAGYIAEYEKNKPQGFILVECPMAKAKWVQKDGPIRNPYYGKTMLTCGRKL